MSAGFDIDISVESEIQKKNSAALIRAFRTYFLIGTCIALFSPINVLESFYWLQVKVDFVSALIPAVSRLAYVSDMPQVIKTYWVAMWVGLPIVTFRIALFWTFSSKTITASVWRKFKVFLSCLILALLFAYLLLFFGEVSPAEFSEISGRGGAMMRVVAKTRIGLSLVGGLIFCCFAFIVGVFSRLFGIWFIKAFRG